MNHAEVSYHYYKKVFIKSFSVHQTSRTQNKFSFSLVAQYTICDREF